MRPLLAALCLLVMVLVLAGGAVAEPADDGPPAWGPVATSPIRPGASLGGYCTFNWVFHGVAEEPGAQPPIYIGTAGHCTDEIGERVSLPGVGEIGEVVYDSDLVGSGVDFSLVELDPELLDRTNPTMLGWDGPNGIIEDGEASLGDRVDVHGYGLLLGQNDVTRSRFGVLMSTSEDEYVANMPAVFGDSGSPLLHHDTGQALGIISRFAFFETPPATDVGPLMGWIFRELDAAGFGDVVLALADPGTTR